MLHDLVDLDQKAIAKILLRADGGEPEPDDAAAKRIEERVFPEIAGVIAQADKSALFTPWGKTQRDTMAAVMNDRRAELGRYVDALRSHDFEAQLASVEKQATIEARAIRAAEAIDPR